MTTLYLIRHGETDNNLQGCFNGSKSNQPLNERGKAQAKCLAAPFAAIAPDAVFASPLCRALDTAKGLCGDLPVTPVTVADLQEMDMGAYDSVSFDEVRKTDPYTMENWNCADIRMPGGECFSEVQSRVSGALANLVAQHRGKTLAVVAHGTLIQLFLMRLWRLSWQEKKKLPILRNTGYVCLHIADDGNVTAACYDEVGHLPHELLYRGDPADLHRKEPPRPTCGHDFVGKTLYFADFAK